jgi:hypothetical protein
MTDNHPKWGGETRILYGGNLAGAVKKAAREMEGLLEGTVSAHIVDARGVIVWDYEGVRP